jgi:predicted nucleotidyltransferase
MIQDNVIQQIKHRLVTLYKPVEIYLFGSYAWGHPNEESDLDLLVVLEKLDKDRYSILVDGHRALRDVEAPKDLLVLSKIEFEEYSEDPREIYYKIKRRGKRIYAKA